MSRSVRVRFSLVLIALALSWSIPMFAADGASLYKAKCAMCHGADGTGNTPVGKSMKVKSLSSDEVQKQTDADLEKAISSGKGKMPSFAGKLSADDLKAVVTFIRGFKK
jgi:cytochrome c6